MTIESKRLTEIQWTCLISDILKAQDELKGKLHRQKFVENWCLEKGLDTIPHASSVGRRLAHHVAVRKHLAKRRYEYYQACHHAIDCELLEKVKEIYGKNYKHKYSGYDDNLCLN